MPTKFFDSESGKIAGSKPKTRLTKKVLEWETMKGYILGQGLQKFQVEMNTLKGMNYCMVFLKFLSYHKPTLQSVQVEEIVKPDLQKLNDKQLREFVELADKIGSEN